MVKYSEDTDYEQIDITTMYELRDARLVQAQIVSIDREENKAEITIVEECEELAEKSLSAVPFFYHCEDSVGTVEDLARGHLAFRDDDLVYCLWVPAAGEVEERFYIVGHTDIKLTKRCSGEFIYIRTEGPPYYITMFDTREMATLNLETFENIDELSPPKPVAFPAEMTQEFLDWRAYNFRTSTVPTGIGAYVYSETQRDIDALVVVTDNAPGVETEDSPGYIGRFNLEYHAYDTTAGYFEHRIYDEYFLRAGSGGNYFNNLNTYTIEQTYAFEELALRDFYESGEITLVYKIDYSRSAKSAGVGSVNPESIVFDTVTVPHGKDAVLNDETITVQLVDGIVNFGHEIYRHHTHSLHYNNTDTDSLERYRAIDNTVYPGVVSGELGVYFLYAKEVDGNEQAHYETESTMRFTSTSGDFERDYIYIPIPEASGVSTKLYLPLAVASIYSDVPTRVDEEEGAVPLSALWSFQNADQELSKSLSATITELDDFVCNTIGGRLASRSLPSLAVAYMKKDLPT